jgi:hypothetical protein
LDIDELAHVVADEKSVTSSLPIEQEPKCLNQRNEFPEA